MIRRTDSTGNNEMNEAARPQRGSQKHSPQVDGGEALRKKLIRRWHGEPTQGSEDAEQRTIRYKQGGLNILPQPDQERSADRDLAPL